MSSDSAFGTISQDKQYKNLNVQNTLGQCAMNIRSRCIATDQLNTNFINGVSVNDILNESFQVGLASFRGVNYRTVQAVIQPAQLTLGNIVGPLYTVPAGLSAFVMGMNTITDAGNGDFLVTIGPSVNTDISLLSQFSIVQTLSTVPYLMELTSLITLGASSELGDSLFLNIRSVNTPADAPIYLTITVMEYEVGNIRTFLQQNVSGTLVPVLTPDVSFTGFNYPPLPFLSSAPQRSSPAIQLVQSQVPAPNTAVRLSANNIPFMADAFNPYPNSRSIGPLPSFDANTTIQMTTPLDNVGNPVVLHIWGTYLLSSAI